MSGLIVPLVLLAVAVAAIVFAVGSGVHEKQVVRESLRTLDGYDIDAPPTDLRQEKLAE